MSFLYRLCNDALCCVCLYSERISRLLLALGDEYKEIKMMSEGNIAVVAGLKHVRTITNCSCSVIPLSIIDCSRLHIACLIFNNDRNYVLLKLFCFRQQLVIL